MDPHKIPFAARQQLQDLLPIRFGFLRTLQHRHLRGVGTKHLAHSQTRDAQHPRDLSFLHSLRMQFQNRGSLTLTQRLQVRVLPVHQILNVYAIFGLVDFQAWILSVRVNTVSAENRKSHQCI